MAKQTAKRPAAPVKNKSRKPDKSHSAKDKHPQPAHAEKAVKAVKAEKTLKPDRVAVHREAAAKAAAAAAERSEAGSPSGNGHNAPSSPPSKEGFDLQEKVKELVRLSKEQGYLTYNDINDALPENIVTGD